MSNLIKDNKAVNLTARVLMFAATAVWIMGFLTISLILLPALTDYLKDPERWGINGAALHVIVAWYMVTCVLVAIVSTVWGLSQVGKWEDVEEEDEEKGQE